MSVTFDIYFFKPKYIEEVRYIESKLHPEEDFIPEIGLIYCLNTPREYMPVYNVDEAVNLIDVGYQIAKKTTGLPRKLEEKSKYSDEISTRIILKLTGRYEGEIQRGKAKVRTFKGREELKKLLG